ncbi:CheB methylesterase domain-containing protein [Scopulibacillus cellulosilyticus]|uniref:protein-glutamate methylesterase n=1 Tax=Scopulibacillus cellulosilyticus TaxID=2665665 RepID=A0ABW2PT27_9BACL
MKKIVCIGASTGGPRALQRVIPRIPRGVPSPILIVQHMPPKFTKSFAERLDRISQLTVCEANNGETIKNGRVYIAPGGYHMGVKHRGSSPKIVIHDAPPIHNVKPSVDMLFQSIAGLEGYQVIAAVLTGMGKDGSQGLKALKYHVSTYAIAESKESAIVYGMPKAAVETGLIDQISHIDTISTDICRQLNFSGS